MSNSSADVLPYDVFEVILSMLDGISVLSISCVCSKWHEFVEAFLSRKSNQYWKTACYKELGERNIRICQSGGFEENWFAVYKSAFIRNTMRSRRVHCRIIPLTQRFIRSRTGVHILGGYLVITQGPMVKIYDVMTGTHFTTQFPGGFNVHDSYIVRKGSGDSCELPCDILVMICGGERCTHVAVTTADTIIDKPPQMIASEDAVPAYSSIHTSRKYVATRFPGCSKNNHIFSKSSCIEVTIQKDSSIQLNKSPRCFDPKYQLRFARAGYSKAKDSDTEICLLNNDVVISWDTVIDSNNDQEITLRDVGDNVYRKIPLHGKLTYNFTLPDMVYRGFARILHIGDDIVPAIATVQSDEQHGKHVAVYTLPQD